MRRNRSTLLTAGLALAAALAVAGSAVAWTRFRAAADDAAAARQDLAEARKFLTDPARRAAAADLGLVGSLTPVSADGGSSNEALGGHLRQAGVAAGVPDLLSSFVPTEPQPVAGTDRQEMRVFLRFDAAPLQGLVRYLHHLVSVEPNVRVEMIELNPPTTTTGTLSEAPSPEGATNTAGRARENWAADVTLVYRVRAPAR